MKIESSAKQEAVLKLLLKVLCMAAAASSIPLYAYEASQQTPIRLSPAQAVMNAAEMPEGVAGVFEMVVRATGRRDGFLYLNSENDYRDQRNLTIDISPAVEKELEERIGGPLEDKLLRKTIAVRGTAKKTRIDFLADGRPTGKYYFQTHVRIQTARALTLEGEHAFF